MIFILSTTNADSFWNMLVALKRAVVFVFFSWLFNLRIRKGYVLDVSVRRQHPWRWQSSSLRAQCMWQHHGWHFPKRLSRHHVFPRRSDQRYVWHHLFLLNDGLLVWWYLGYYHATPSCDVWRLLYLDLFLLYLFLTCCLLCEVR